MPTAYCWLFICRGKYFAFPRFKTGLLSIASGIILFLIGLDIVFPRKGLNPDQDYEDPFIVPLAVPMVAGHRRLPLFCC
ncbi:MAG: hypothetical protein H7A08_07860 [Oceanospirillaceae bacterium]|nr:hypothetical protein [Oceanospirillaceae bacterium]